jgi:hypothetical protein
LLLGCLLLGLSLGLRLLLSLLLSLLLGLSHLLLGRHLGLGCLSRLLGLSLRSGLLLGRVLLIANRPTVWPKMRDRAEV